MLSTTLSSSFRRQECMLGLALVVFLSCPANEFVLGRTTQGLLLQNSTVAVPLISHPEEASIALIFRPPTCIEKRETFHCSAFVCHAHGLVRGARYLAHMQIKNGPDIIFSKEWELENEIFNATSSHLSLEPHTVRISILDGYRGLSRDESVLTTMIRPIDVRRKPGANLQSKRCTPMLIWPLPNFELADSGRRDTVSSNVSCRGSKLQPGVVTLSTVASVDRMAQVQNRLCRHAVGRGNKISELA